MNARWTPRLAARMEWMQASEIRELLRVIEKPGVISFAGGIPDPALFPQERIREAFDRVLSDPARAARALQYSPSEGEDDLRAWVAEHMTGKGVPCGVENILITNGSQQGLELLAKMFVSPGDSILAAAPTYLGALQAFSACQPNFETLRLTGTNATAETYREAASQAGGQAAFAYVVPDFANPSGETMDAPMRQRLIDLATELEIPVIEDSPYSELRYDGDPVAPVQAIDIAGTGSVEASRVIHLGSFSKIFTPGLRIGWVTARRDVIQRLAILKQASDLNSPRLNQMVTLDVARTSYPDQVQRARAHYRPKRDAMLAALAEWMPEGTSWSGPEGGMFLWLTLPGGFDAARLLPRAVEAGVAFVPGEAFFADRSGKNTMRLSFSLPTEAEIGEGIRLLAAVVAG